MNMDVKRRDELIFGAYEPEKYSGGIRRFEIGASKLRKLYDEGYMDPDDSQNMSPTAKEFMDLTFELEDYTDFECYAVSPERQDCRITIEGVQINVDAAAYEVVAELVSRFRNADEFEFSSYGNKYYMRAWWD